MRILTGVAVLVSLSASAIAAQNPQTRNGFTISFGVGGGSAGVTCEGCGTDRENAPSGYLRIGGAIRPNLVLAGEANAWTKKETEEGADATVTIGTVNFVAQWYPQPTSGFFVSAGVGAGSMRVDVDVPGLGYSLRAYKRIWLPSRRRIRHPPRPQLLPYSLCDLLRHWGRKGGEHWRQN